MANREESRALSGVRDVMQSARDLAVGDRSVVVHDGARGCWVARGEDVTAVAGFPVVAEDTNGAGDVHNGVFLAGLLRGEDPLVAARRANLAAALIVQGGGPITVATAAELDVGLDGPQK